MKKIGLLGFVSGLMLSTSVQASTVYVRDIQVQGLERVEPETVKSYLDIAEETTVSQDKLDNALNNFMQPVYLQMLFLIFKITDCLA